jgi:hypothetical protein
MVESCLIGVGLGIDASELFRQPIELGSHIQNYVLKMFEAGVNLLRLISERGLHNRYPWCGGEIVGGLKFCGTGR